MNSEDLKELIHSPQIKVLLESTQQALALLTECLAMG